MAFGAISCEDMLSVDSKIYLFGSEHNLDDPTDTVYSILGIVNDLQKVADRTVLLGEIRGDLVTTSAHTNKDLSELYDYRLQEVSTANRYNSPEDYYKIINDCNYFLSKADTALVKDGRNVFLREYIEVLSYRAWTYLQMAQIYGKVYYVDKPILSGDDAHASKWDTLDIKQVATRLLDDYEAQNLESRISDPELFPVKIPNYGEIGGVTGSTGESTKHTSTDFFIPMNIILGDLALWAEQYEKAAIYYQAYLNDVTNARPSGITKTMWYGYDWIFLDPNGDEYAQSLGTNAAPICYIPMEADEYNGIVSDLPNIFNSTKDNDYWYQLTRSRALTSLSTRQDYCFHWINANTGYEDPRYMANKMDQTIELRRGDLRLQAILTSKSRTLDEYAASNVSTTEQTLIKINSEKICLYRNDVVYLRLAEALNRAELPQLAFAVLKTGLCDEVIDSLSQYEYDKAVAKGLSSVLDYDDSFRKAKYQIETSQVDPEKASRSIEIDGNRQNVVKYNTKIRQGGNVIGIHSRGCGDAEIDSTYSIGNKLKQMGIDVATASLKDSIRAVEEYLIDEMALETCFEGYRFGDLMRISMHRAADGNGGFAENDFLARRVASRASATMQDPWAGMDGSLYDMLKGDGSSFNRNWFLKLPED